MTAVTRQSKKLFQMKLKTTKHLLEPTYGKKSNNLFGQPNIFWT